MSSTFRFKHFELRQDNCSMKVNTDGVLLGAWSKIDQKTNTLDIGTGTGVIALMLAQRAPNLKVDAIEIDEVVFLQSSDNIANSKFSNRINVIHQPIQSYSEQTGKLYDLIVSNPPYFNDGIIAKNRLKANARHTILLPHHELLSAVNKLLTKNGHFDLILPYVEGLQFIIKAEEYSLYPSELIKVFPKIDKPIERLLIRFSRSLGYVKEDQLIIQNSDTPNDYSEAFTSLTKDFYIFM